MTWYTELVLLISMSKKGAMSYVKRRSSMLLPLVAKWFTQVVSLTDFHNSSIALSFAKPLLTVLYLSLQPQSVPFSSHSMNWKLKSPVHFITGYSVLNFLTFHHLLSLLYWIPLCSVLGGLYVTTFTVSIAGLFTTTSSFLWMIFINSLPSNLLCTNIAIRSCLVFILSAQKVSYYSMSVSFRMVSLIHISVIFISKILS